MSFSMRWRIPAIGVIVVLAFIYLPDEPFVARFSNLWGDVRFKIWPDTVGLVKAFPLFGCGLGGYKSCFMRFQTVAPMNTVDYAHNDYLQILAEFGLIAFLAGLLFAARLLRATIRRSIHAPSQDHRLLAIACTASLVAMLLHSFVDFNLYVPANGAVFAWICGIAATHCREI
jgi:O-antigen ligase